MSGCGQPSDSMEAVRTTVMQRRPYGLRRVPSLEVLLVIACAGCGDEPLAPADPTVDPPVERAYTLTRANDHVIPALVVDGNCIVWALFIPIAFPPDTLLIDGGALRLHGDGRYEVFYTWRGQTDACTTLQLHWHRISHGRYKIVGDDIRLSPDTTAPPIRPTNSRQIIRDVPHATKRGNDVLVNWRSLSLHYSPT